MERARPRAAAAPEPDLELGRARQLLQSGRVTPEFLERWLPETWQRRASFRRALYAAAMSRADGGIKSNPELSLDLYTDCVTVHLGKKRAALVLVQDGRPLEVSYEALHARCSALASSWRKAGVKAGASLAVVLPVNLDYAVAVLSALRLGLVITPIPPLGAAYVRARLAVLEVDHVVTSERLTHWLPPGSDAPLPTEARGGDATAAGSHAYAREEPALRLLSPFTAEQLEPRELCAAELHAGLLRDAQLMFALEPAERFAAPGFDPLQWQPLALLCTLIAGATWVQCSLADVSAQPRLLEQCGVTLLGVDTHLRDLVFRLGPDVCKRVRAWFRSLNDAFDYAEWHKLADGLEQYEVNSFALLYNAATGGAQLFSPRAQRDRTGRVWPAPGGDFVIAPVGGSLAPSLDATGVYTPLRDEEADVSLLRVVIAKLDAGWTWGGSIDVGPQGRSLPRAELAASACRDARVGAASVVVVPGRWPNTAHVILLAFVAEPEDVRGTLAEDLKRAIARDLGEPHVPQRVEVFALHPRFAGSTPRADWCSSQYASGMLFRKARTPLFQTLSRLAWIFDPNTHTP